MIDWQKAGHFRLLPDMPERAADPSSHRYTHLLFKGLQFQIPAEFFITGARLIDSA